MINKPTRAKKPKPRGARGKTSDTDLWGHVTESVDPLDERYKNRTPDVEVDAFAVDDGPKVGGKRKPSRSVPATTVKAAPSRSTLPELRHGEQPGLDKSTAKKLKKGQQPIEGRMDLHGMTREQAHRALNSFIDGSHAAKKRCVLVITGKGWKPDGSVGVLRTAVPRWLNEEPNRGRVLAFHYATPKDGGEGALYVMLKRKR